MPLLTKQILKVGTYHSPDGEVRVTPNRIKHWVDNFKAMRKGNLVIPSGWDHSNDPDKLTPVAMSVASSKKFRSAKDVAGMLTELKATPDGQALEVTLDIPNKEDYEKAKNNVVQISPVIYDRWTDGQKRQWEDSITHVDLVTHPVDASQSPFVPAEQAIACSLRFGKSKGKAIALSLYQLKGKKRMALEDIEDEKKDDEPEAKAEDEKAEGIEVPAVETEDSTSIADVLADLASLKIMLPTDTTPENFFDRFRAALATAKAHKETAETEDKQESAGMQVKEPQYAAMSLEAKAAHNYANKLHRDSLASRLSTLLKSGRCTQAEHDNHAKSLGAVKLSLDSQGNHQEGDLEKWLLSREALPAGAAMDLETRTRMSSLNAAEIPAGLTGELTEEDADKLVDLTFRKRA